MRFQQTVAPTIEPVTETELISHSQLGELPDDQLLAARSMIVAARQWVENRLHRQLITATWIAHLDTFESVIQIRNKLPIKTISSITYYDSQDTLQTLSSSLYQTDLISENCPPRIEPVSGQSWPSTYDRMNAVRITFTAGYGATAESVPLGIRHAILMLACTWFENRENEVIGTITANVNTGVEMCLQAFDWGAYS